MRNRTVTLARLAVTCCLALLGAALWGAGAASADKLIIVNSTADSGPGLSCEGGGTCTLRRAVEEITAGKYSGAVTVEFSVHGVIEIAAFGPLELEVPEKVTSVQIVGPGSGEPITVSGEETSRIFEVEGGEVTLERLTLAEGKRDGTTIGASGGGAIYQGGGTLALRDMLLRDNSVESSRSGGAIYQDEGNLRIVDSTIEASSTDSDVFAGSAGAIFVDTSNSNWLELDGTRITGSSAEGRGGAIFQNSGSVIIKDSELDHNTASNNGGAIYADADGSVAKTTIEESRLLGNTSGSEGGAIYSDNGDAGLTLLASTVAGNKADGGAGIAVQGPTKVLRSTISGNEADATAGYHGGGIAVDSSSVEVVSSTIANNVGEGIYFQFSGSSIVGSTIASNKSNGEAGGIAGPEIISVTSSILAYNEGHSGPADCAIGLESGGHNLVTEAGTGVCEWDAPGDKVGTDPKLGLLADNGGPTQTMGPITRTSPLINAGSHPGSEGDQRGLTRPVPTGEFTDVGAYELQLPTSDPQNPPAISPATGLKVGDTLTCTPGTWEAGTVTDPAFEYRWKAGSEQVGTEASYKLLATDAGKQITCQAFAEAGPQLEAEATSAAVELPPAVPALAPASLAFATQTVGSAPSAAKALTLTNEGGAPLLVEAVEVEATGGSAPEQFSVDGSACTEGGGELAAYASCEIEARFEPTAIGAQTATVTVKTAAGNGTATLSGTGAAVELAVSPAEFNFGPHEVASPSAMQAFTVTNEGAAVDLGTALLEGSGAGQFELVSDCDGETLAPAGSCEVEARFLATAAGVATATLTVPAAAGAVGAAEAALSGTATEAPEPEPEPEPEPKPEPKPTPPNPTPPGPTPSPVGLLKLPPDSDRRVLGAGVLTAPLACQEPAGAPCQLTLVLRRGPQRLAQWTGTVPAGTTKRARVPLSPQARTLLTAKRKLRARAILTVAGGPTTRVPLTLLAPKR